jgi:hypothetical protein
MPFASCRLGPFSKSCLKANSIILPALFSRQQPFAALAHERRRINAEREAVALRSMIASMVAASSTSSLSSSGRTHGHTTPRRNGVATAEDGGSATPRSAALSPRSEEVCVCVCANICNM